MNVVRSINTTTNGLARFGFIATLSLHFVLEVARKGPAQPTEQSSKLKRSMSVLVRRNVNVTVSGSAGVRGEAETGAETNMLICLRRRKVKRSERTV